MPEGVSYELPKVEGTEVDGAGEYRRYSPEEIKDLALREIKKRVKGRFANEPYHNPGHSEGVGNAAKDILALAEETGMEVTDGMRLGVEVAAAAHDMFIRTRVNKVLGTLGYGTLMRYRGTTGEIIDPETGEIELVEKMPGPVRDALKDERWKKGNEEASWLEVEHIMDEADPDGIVFTSDVREIIRAAIAATYPDVEFPASYPSVDDVRVERRDPTTQEVQATIDLTDFLPKKDGKPAGLKFFQPFVHAKSSLAVVAIAMGDLSEGGRVDAREFRRKGNAEYWELRPLLRERIANGFADFSKEPEKRFEEMSKAAQDMLGWIQSQAGFLLWQKIRYREILDTNDAINANTETARSFKEKMNGVYSQFDANILDAFDRSQRLTGRFDQLLNPATFAQNSEAEQHLRDLARQMDYDELPY